MKTSNNASAAVVLRTVVGLLLIIGIGWLLWYYAVVATTRYPDFDGALNLNVSQSLLDGTGYGSFYERFALFPIETQTNGPYVIPAAASIWLLGVTPLGTQLINFLFLLGLLVLVFVWIRRIADPLAALLGVFVVLQAPGMYWFAMNGYGEVPALTFYLASLLLLSRSRNRGAGVLVLGGVLLGLSFLTKTVSLIWFPPTFCALLWLHAGARPLKAGALTAVGTALPVAGWEIFRMTSLGGVGPYAAWWTTQANAVGARMGLVEQFQDTPGLLSKGLVHLAILNDWTGSPAPWLSGVALVQIAVASIPILRLWHGQREAQFLMFCAGAVALIYFAWFLLINPTWEAWLRRIMNGFLLLLLVLVPATAVALRTRTPSARLIAALGAVVLGTLTWHNQLLVGRPDPRPQASADREFFAAVAALPENAILYGTGWYQAPVAALVARRRMHDLERISAPVQDAAVPRFVVLDQYAMNISRETLAGVLEKCRCRPLFANGGGRIYAALDVGRHAADDWRSTSIDPTDASFGPGFHDGATFGRWAGEHSSLKLDTGEFDIAVIGLTAPNNEAMTNAGAPTRLTVSLGTCMLGEFELVDGRNDLIIENKCPPATPAEMRFEVNGHIRPGLIADSRELSWLLTGIELQTLGNR